MISLSGKIADKIAAKKAAEHIAKPVVKKSKKMSTTVKGAVASKLKKDHIRTKKLLDKKANPESLKKSRAKVKLGLKKLNLKSAGFGRYHKGKGTPVTHWVMRHPKTGLYLLADKKLHDTLTAKYAPKTVKKVVKKTVEKKSTKVKAQSRLAHEENKKAVIDLHLKRLDEKRAKNLAAKGKKADKPLTVRETAARNASVKRLHKTLDTHFKAAKVAHRAERAKRNEAAGKIVKKI